MRPDNSAINRYWDPVHRVQAAKILPGQYYIADDGELVVTVLGSCVAACVRDVQVGVGGMNHFMLPVCEGVLTDRHGAAERYGEFAMQALVDGVLERGGRRDRLEVQLVGGARMLEGHSDIGALNIDFARRHVEAERLRVAGADLGGVLARKVYYFPSTGLTRIRRLYELKNDTVLRRDQDYQTRLDGWIGAGGRAKPVIGEDGPGT
jgi:chemotaxis protein CheD